MKVLECVKHGRKLSLYLSSKRRDVGVIRSEERKRKKWKTGKMR
jgi:hypothetical protein